MTKNKLNWKELVISGVVAIGMTMLTSVMSYTYRVYHVLNEFPEFKKDVRETVKQVNNLNNATFRLNVKVENIKKDIKEINHSIDSTNVRLIKLEKRHNKLLKYVIDNSKMLKRNEENTIDKELVSR